jgi:GxxExxY protein
VVLGALGDLVAIGYLHHKPLYMTFEKLSDHEEDIGRAIVNASYRVHTELGPGLLEKVYEVCVTHELRKAGIAVARQVSIPIHYDDITFEEGLRLDLLVENKVIVEIKSVEQVNPVWQAQVLSHLKLTGLSLGYLINFNVPLIKGGIKRIIL